MITDGGGSAEAIGELHIAPGVECAVKGPVTVIPLGIFRQSKCGGRSVRRLLWLLSKKSIA